MKRINLFATVIVLSLAAFVQNYVYAQQTSIQFIDVEGKNWRQKSYVSIVGSPFLQDEWAKGIISFKDNTIANGVDLKYDLIDDVLLFKDQKGATLEVANPVSEFKIDILKNDSKETRLFRSGFKPVGSNNEQSFYEILSDGNVKFVKKTIKVILTSREYNSASDVQKFTEKAFYFIVKDNQPVQVNKNEKSILAAIGDKNDRLSAYVKENKLNLKNDQDILKLLEHYFDISK